jgi:hypothetical protein
MNTNECKPLRIYIAGQYTAPTIEEIQENVNMAIEVGISLYEKGHFPLIPHLSHYVDTYKLTSFRLTWNDYMRCDLSWLSVADAMFFMGHSTGADVELEAGKEAGLKIFYYLEDVPRGISIKQYSKHYRRSDKKGRNKGYTNGFEDGCMDD